MLGYDDLLRLTYPSGGRVLRYNDLAGVLLLPMVDRCRMLGYDNLSCPAASCRRHMFGYHGLTRAFGLGWRYVLGYDDLLLLTYPCRSCVLRYNDLAGRSRLIWSCR
jgi:hypothetical protein